MGNTNTQQSMNEPNYNVKTHLEDAYASGVLAGRRMITGEPKQLPGLTKHLQLLTVGFERSESCTYSQAKDMIDVFYHAGWRDAAGWR